jgi:hypothetical protein
MAAWRFAGSQVEGRRFELIPGLDVWSQEWRSVKDETIEGRLQGVAYGHQGGFNVYEIDGPHGPVQFVAGEVSNQVYAFYLPAEER